MTEDYDTSEIRINTTGPDAWENARQQLAVHEGNKDSVIEVDVRIAFKEGDNVVDIEEVKEEIPERGFDSIKGLNRLRQYDVEYEDRSMSGDRAYPVLRFIEENASPSNPVTATDVEVGTGLGASTTSLLTQLSRYSDFIERRDSSKKNVQYEYIGLSESGRELLEDLESEFAAV